MTMPIERRPAMAARRVLVAGGAGALGAAVLERLLQGSRFGRVGVLAQPRLQPALRGLSIVPDEDAALAAFGPDTALVVFDSARRANGREAAFVRPEPESLAPLAARLHAAGARTLLVVVPHRPALLPQALKAGLSNLDEGSVTAMGFDRLVFMRMAQAGGTVAGAPPPWPQRLAGWLLSQLHWLVPAREQPVRTETVARVAAALALALPAAPPGTRVLPPEWLWLAAQGSDADALMASWLAGSPLPPAPVRQRW